VGILKVPISAPTDLGETNRYLKDLTAARKEELGGGHGGRPGAKDQNALEANREQIECEIKTPHKE
jgi:hypothetical protein